MKAIPRLTGTLVLAAFVLPAFAAEQAAPGRELLQPPKVQVASPITDRFALRGVYFRPTVDTMVRYDSSAGAPGTLLDAEDTLGLPGQRDMGSLDMMFRMLERHRIRADFTKLSRGGDTLLGQPVFYGDDQFFANERVRTAMDLRKLGLTYTYSALRREKVEIGLGLGLHLLQLDGTVEAPARFVRERLDTAGPFATLVADATWRVTRRFSLNASAHYLDASIDEVEGGYTAWHADVQYRAWRNLSFGAGYSHTRYRIDSTDPDFSGYFNLKYSGPEAFVRVSF